MQSHRVSWLAGLWDGEGSIGLTLSGRILILQCQMSMTCPRTIAEALDVMNELGVRARSYTFSERKAHYLDAWLLRVNGMGNIKTLGEALLPFTVTKKEPWTLALDWIDRRAKAAGGFDEQGRLRRGGPDRQRGYPAEDLAVARLLRNINRAGKPAGELDHLVAG